MPKPALRRELRIWEVIGLSVALTAPSMAANINPQGTASAVGRAVPLAFALATAGVLLVAWGFVRMTQRLQHAGSVYGFAGVTLGPRCGLLSGWALAGAYAFFAVTTTTATGIFCVTSLKGLGLWANPPDWAAFPLAAVALLGVLTLTLVPIRRGTRVLLSVESVTVVLILAVALVVLVRVASGHAPSGQRLGLAPFTLEPGTSTNSVFQGVVFGFLSFAGFEAAATLGEESRAPHKDIPRAIFGTAVCGGIYFVFVTWVEVIGFGGGTGGMASFRRSGSLLGDLGTEFVGPAVGNLISLGAMVSAFGCALASTIGVSRLLYAAARDGAGARAVGTVSARHGAPTVASCVTAGFVTLALLAGVSADREPLTTFLWAATIGTILLLVTYTLATVGAMRLTFLPGPTPIRRWELAVPVLGLALLGYTIWDNIRPVLSGVSAGPPFWQAVVSLLWLAFGLTVLLLRPDVVRSVGRRLASEEGSPRP
ncbi:APC family permease [Streptomyces antibioticus]|uniref:APC family permease n=1 Tax=Streptomyces antibioticus TaxID=1890 RepID=UPI0033D11508